MNDFSSLDSQIRATVVELSDSAPTAPTSAELGLDASLQSYAPTPSAKPSLRTRLSRLFAIGGLLAGGAGVAYVAANQGDDRSSPEAAFEAFAEAVANEDGIGLLESIDPNERAALQPAIDEVLVEFNRIGLLNNVEVSSDPLDGFDFEILGLELDSTTLDDGLVAIRVTDGRMISRTEPGAIPIGDPTKQFVGAGIDDDLREFGSDFDGWLNTIDQDLDRYGIEFIAVERDGEWYLSVGYTVLDIISKVEGWDAPDFGNGFVPNGQDSPEAVLEAWLGTSLTDVEDRIALLDPQQMAAFYDYGPLIASAVDGGMDGVTIESVVTRLVTQRDGNRVFSTDYAVSTITAESLDGGLESQSYETDFDGSCVRTSVVGAPDGSDTEEPEARCVADELTDSERYALENLELDIAVVERDGKWFVDPVATLRSDALKAAASVEGQLDDDATVDLFTGLLLSDSLFSDVIGFGGVRGSVVVTDGSIMEADMPPAFECQMIIFDSTGIHEGQQNLEPDDDVRAEYDACIAALGETSVPGMPVMSYDELLGTMQCSAEVEPLYTELYPEPSEAGPDVPYIEPDSQQLAEIDAQYQQCLADAGIGLGGS